MAEVCSPLALVEAVIRPLSDPEAEVEPIAPRLPAERKPGRPLG